MLRKLSLLLPVAVLLGCASQSTATPATNATLPATGIGPTGWEGPAADAARRSAREPVTPGLRPLRGRVPLLYITRGPWSASERYEPSYEVALFDDGTLVFEGHRCVRLGGLVVFRIAPEQLARVKRLLATSCVDLDTMTEDEVCDDRGNLRLSCSNGNQMLAGSDHCRRDQEPGKRLGELAAAALAELDIVSWLGEPTERQACEVGDKDLGPGELARMVPPRI